MPLAPKGDEDVRQPPPQDPGAVHPGMAAGAERHQLGVVAGVAVVRYRLSALPLQQLPISYSSPPKDRKLAISTHLWSASPD